jgi:type I restriction enzyme S subunit
MTNPSVLQENDCVWSHFADCVDILDSRRIPLNHIERGKNIGNIPYYGANGLVGFVNDFLVLLAEDGGNFLDRNRSIAYLINGKSWVNNHAHVLRGKTGILNNRFLCYYLNTVDYKKYVCGSTRLKLNQNAMLDIMIPRPSLSAQQKIVSTLDNQFAEINKIKNEVSRAIVANENLVCSNLIAMFQFITSNSKCYRSLGDVTKITSGMTPLRSNSEYYGGTIPWIQTGELRDSVIYDSREKITKLALLETHLRLNPANTLLVAMYGQGKTRGKTGLVKIEAATN